VSAKSYLDGKVVVHGGDCLDVLRGMESCSVDSVVTDPPYALTIGKGSADVRRGGLWGV
jgi:DNA modification methylase